MAFQVPPADVDGEVVALREKGVAFRTFEAEGLSRVDGVASFGEFRSAWFADPEGTVLDAGPGVRASAPGSTAPVRSGARG
ncbi:MAG TPA: hypothetical protein VLQ78_04190 [Ornithinibacter sp.]|nr:hypothetical protein [Ornithinibacter sp.]